MTSSIRVQQAIREGRQESKRGVRLNAFGGSVSMPLSLVTVGMEARLEAVQDIKDYVEDKAPQADVEVRRYQAKLFMITIDDIPMPFWKQVVAPGLKHVLDDCGQLSSYQVEKKDGKEYPTFKLRVGEIK